MSYAGAYSGLYSAETDEIGVKILDPETFETHKPDKAITSELALGEGYPKEQWTVLFGFETYDEPSIVDETTTLTLERVARGYSDDGFEEWWGRVSEYTEPFWFYHSPAEWSFPTVREVRERDAPAWYYKCHFEEGQGSVERVYVCEDGDPA